MLSSTLIPPHLSSSLEATTSLVSSIQSIQSEITNLVQYYQSMGISINSPLSHVDISPQSSGRRNSHGSQTAPSECSKLDQLSAMIPTKISEYLSTYSQQLSEKRSNRLITPNNDTLQGSQNQMLRDGEDVQEVVLNKRRIILNDLVKIRNVTLVLKEWVENIDKEWEEIWSGGENAALEFDEIHEEDGSFV
ncbi:hypothetical protein BKA69DRAFT_1175216 [Paraphysoderma sedebokerense]|nr:hypothetical protein BKA69DRAFT_1175216 [Paraphysoderma sedebokerense]